MFSINSNYSFVKSMLNVFAVLYSLLLFQRRYNNMRLRNGSLADNSPVSDYRGAQKRKFNQIVCGFTRSTNSSYSYAVLFYY